MNQAVTCLCIGAWSPSRGTNRQIEDSIAIEVANVHAGPVMSTVIFASKNEVGKRRKTC